jgi:hypothetical protein
MPHRPSYLAVKTVAIAFAIMFNASSLLAAGPKELHFENDIEPLLSRHGCNASGCHGKAEGQGGFKLSVFSFDPIADYAALVKEARGRRVNPSAPDESLLLRKASGAMPHGGGTRLKADTKDYATLRSWIAAGMPVGDPNAPKLVALRVEPTGKVLGFKSSQVLHVFAKYSDGREAEVTEHARFQVNHEGLATVTASGVVATTETPGEVAVMAAYMGEVALFRAIVPRPGKSIEAKKLPEFNFIDKLVDKKLSKLNITPSGICDDAEFLRRVTLDLVGSLPTPQEVQTFLADRNPLKRGKRVEELLKRPEFADLMAKRWADILRVDRQALGHERAFAYYRWIRDAFAKNQPFDAFARELITAEGPLREAPQAGFFKVVPKPGEAASTISQVFLGVRIACAECHHHPSDRWTQTDYTGMVSFFTPLSTKGSGASEALIHSGDPISKHPRSGESVFAYAIGTEQPKVNPSGDRRVVLARWMTDPKNPYFATNLANRVWAMLLGRGLVEPVDDVRATNPPSNPELLDALATLLVKHKFDVRELVRVICASRVYQTSSSPNETNEKDDLNFSRALFKRPDAEVLLDMLTQVTGVAERYPGMPAGTKAIQLWDSKTKHEFLRLFGRPQRMTACECERNQEPSAGQVLNLLNSPDLQKKLSHESGMIAKLARSLPDDGKVADEVYLRLYGRFPTAKERDTAAGYLARKSGERRKAVEDLVWAMLNSLEFQFNH